MHSEPPPDSLITFCGRDSLGIERQVFDADANEELYRGQGYSPIVIGLSSQHCFTIYRDRDQRKPLKSRQLISYELEDCVPIDADELSIAPIASNDGTLFIAASGSDVAEFVNSSVSPERFTAAVTPIALLAIAGLKREIELEGSDLVIWVNHDFADLLWIRHGVIVGWRWCAVDALSIDQCIDRSSSQAETDTPDRTILVNVSDQLTDRLALDSDVLRLEFDQEVLAEQEAEQICRGNCVPIADLRNGPLVPDRPFFSIAGPLQAFLFALVMMQVSVIIAACYRASRMQGDAVVHFQSQAEAFRSVFPDQPVPVGILSRLESEHRRLSGTKGIGKSRVPDQGSVIPLTHQLLSALPGRDSTKFELLRIDLGGSTIRSLSGNVLSYGDLEEIAGNLREAGFDVPAVAGTKTSAGTSLRLENVIIRQSSGDSESKR